MERIVVTAVPIQNNVTVVTDETTVNISAPVTSIVQVNTPGPQGSIGLQGQPGTITDTGSFVVTSSFNNFTSSYQVDSSSFNIRINSLTNSTSLFVTNSQTSSFIKNNQTGSFAITGSNTFIGDQIVTGSLYIMGSVNADSQVYEVSFLDTDDPTFPIPGYYLPGDNLIVLDQDLITNANYIRDENTISVNSSGLYKIYVQCRLDIATGLSTDAELAVFINDNPYKTYYIKNIKSEDTSAYNFTCIANLNSSDNIRFHIYANTQPFILRTFSKIYNSVISSYMTIEKLN